jgi:lysyl-tRNA synthetase class 1
VAKKLIDYGSIKNSEPHIEQLIELAGNYADDFEDDGVAKIEINSETKTALSKLITLLEGDKEPEDLQNAIYNIAKENNVQPKDFFMVLYQIIINASRGPKIGPFIMDIGRKKVAQTISKHI